MINQIQNNTNNVFAPLQSSARNYAITTPITQEQKHEHKERKNKRLGFLIAGAGLIVGFGTLFLTQLLSKKSALRLDKIGKRAEELISNAKKGNSLSGFQKRVYLPVLKIVKNLASRYKVMFTTATLRDIFVTKPFVRFKFLNKITKPITNAFEKVSVSVSKLSYKRTGHKLDNMYAKMTELCAKLSPEKAAEVKKLIEAAKIQYAMNFSESVRNVRFARATDGMKNFHNEVWARTFEKLKSRKGFKSFLDDKDMFSKFLAEEVAKDAKSDFNKAIYDAKDVISLSATNKFRTTKHFLANIDMYVDPTDVRSRELMQKLKSHMKDFNEKSFNPHSEKEFPGVSIVKDLTELGEHVKTSEIYKKKDNDAIKNITESIKEVCDVLSHKDKRGQIQDIMEIFNEAKLPADDHQALSKVVNKTIRSLDFTVDQEGDKLFDKVRDLKLGSAIHDTIAFLGSIVAMGWFINKAETKDDKRSVALKYAVPLVGGLAVTIVCAVGLIASGPSFFIGGISGLLFNRAGELIDKEIKKRNQQKLAAAEAANK